MVKIIDYYADWCGPCRMLKPILQELDQERDDISVEYINIDENMNAAQDNNVLSLPTLVFEKNGSEFFRIQGVTSKDRILNIIDS